MGQNSAKQAAKTSKELAPKHHSKYQFVYMFDWNKRAKHMSKRSSANANCSRALYNHIFVTNVSRLMAERRMTRKNLSDLSGVSLSFLSDILADKANPSFRILENIAKALGVHLPLLLDQNFVAKKWVSHLKQNKKIQHKP